MDKWLFIICSLLFLAHLSLRFQLSFSDQNLSIVRCHCWLFTFSSSPEPLSQFQPNLAQSILGWRGFTIVQKKGPTLFQREIIKEQGKYIVEIKKSSSPEPLSQFQANLAQSIFGWRGFNFFSNEGSWGDNCKIVKIHWQYLKMFFSRATWPISTKLCTIKASLGEEK